MSTLERRQLWSAMADLYLDTEVRWDLPWLARRMSESSFSRLELERIFKFEVTPVVHTNLLDIAGEWSGFSDEWLFPAIEAQLARARTMTDAALERRYAKQKHAHAEWLAVLGFYDQLQRLPREDWATRTQIWRALARFYFEDGVDLSRDATWAELLCANPTRAWVIFEQEFEPIMRSRLYPSDPTPERARANIVTLLELFRKQS
jgi:hypothetical protein